MTKRFVLLAAVPALLAACAVQPAVYKESDLNWSEVTVAGAVPLVIHSIEERTRRGGFLIDTITADGSFFPDAK